MKLKVNNTLRTFRVVSMIFGVRFCFVQYNLGNSLLSNKSPQNKHDSSGPIKSFYNRTS